MTKTWIVTNVTQGRLNVPGLRCILGPGETVEVKAPVPVTVSILAGRPRLVTIMPKVEPAQATAETIPPKAAEKRRPTQE